MKLAPMSLALSLGLLTGCPETTPPTVPGGLSATATSCTTIAVSWSAATDDGGSGLQGYRLYRDGVLVRETAVPIVAVTETTASYTSYAYAVAAFDGAGNESPRSTAVTVATPACQDTTAPSRPAGVAATPTTCTVVALTWSPSTDTGGSGLKGYDIYRAGSLLTQVAAPGTTATDTGLTPATTYSYVVRAVDGAGNFAASDPVSVGTPACAGQPPVANAGADRSVQTLTNVAFDGSASFDPDGTIKSYSWTFGDGGTAVGVAAQHPYATPGIRTVTLTVTDSSGISRSDTAAITATNRPPVAEAGAGKTATPGVAVQFNGNASTDADGRITGYQWAFGDGASGSGVTQNHVYPAAGTYTVWLTATDDFGAQGTDSTTVTVSGGGYLWSRAFGGTTFTDSVTVRAVAGAANGDLVVAGYFSGTVNFGGGNLTSAGGNDIFVAQYSSDTGAPVWVRRYGGTSNDFAAGLAADANGNVVLSGGFSGSVDFGGGPLTSAGGYDVFAMRLSPSGDHLWSRRYGGTGDDSAAGMAVAANGDVVVTGTFNGTTNLGGGSLTSAGSSDVFVARYVADTGTHSWSRRVGGAGIDKVFGVAMDDWGRVTAIGTFAGNASFGGSTLASAGGLDVFVAEYAGADGTHQWSKRFGGSGDDYGNAIAADRDGNVVVTGQFANSIDFGGGALSNAGAPDIFLARLSAAGAHGWSRRYGSSNNYQQVATGVAVDLAGNVVLGANLIGAVDFGGGALPVSGGYDPVLVKLSADGTHLWSKRFGSPQYAYNYNCGVALDAIGDTLAAGTFSGTMDLGGGPLANAVGLVNQSYDLFVAKFAP